MDYRVIRYSSDSRGQAAFHVSSDMFVSHQGSAQSLAEDLINFLLSSWESEAEDVMATVVDEGCLDVLYGEESGFVVIPRDSSRYAQEVQMGFLDVGYTPEVLSYHNMEWAFEEQLVWSTSHNCFKPLGV